MYEDKLIKQIKGGTAAIKRGEKSPEEASLGSKLNSLKPLNPGMYEELMNNYKSAIESYSLTHQ